MKSHKVPLKRKIQNTSCIRKMYSVEGLQSKTCTGLHRLVQDVDDVNSITPLEVPEAIEYPSDGHQVIVQVLGVLPSTCLTPKSDTSQMPILAGSMVCYQHMQVILGYILPIGGHFIRLW